MAIASGPITKLKRFSSFVWGFRMFSCTSRSAVAANGPTNIYGFTVKDIDGNEVSLSKYKGHVALIVNVASQCGLTNKNYAQLQELHAKYAESKGLRILAFPCNQFGGQEPGTDEQIKEFAAKKGAQFDLFDKINVNGDNAIPLYKFLKKKQHGTLTNAIKWNFSKFLINKKGEPVKRYGPQTAPKDIEKDIVKELDQPE
uniref:Glutathione peroxidase n=1 Tax=Patiria miniata TaxID=46514 RepID=A0A913ZZ30_PATMI